MKKLFFVLFIVIATAASANDTVYYRLSHPRNGLKKATGNYLRKAVQTDSGWLALDFNEHNILIARSFYTDTSFTAKLHCAYYFDETAGYLQEISCYKNGKLDGLNILFNEKGDTLHWNRFVNDEISEGRQFPGYQNREQAYGIVEVEAVFTGAGGWGAFMSKHLRPNVPVKQKAPDGTYQVIIQFIVDKDGSVTQVTPITHFGYGMEEEVMRVILKSPKWRPATQGGKPVKAYRKQPITFVVSGKK